MKVALVCPYDLGKPGGVQDQVIRLAGWLEARGHPATIIGPGTQGPQGAVLVGSTSVITANAAATPIAIDPRVRSRIFSAVEGADVVHIHEPLMPVVSLAAVRIGGLPTVGTFHADPPRWVRKGYTTLSPFLRRVLRKLDVVTTVSPVANSAIEPVVAARVIPNGIDVPSYGRADKVAGRVVFLGRDDPRKGLDVLLEAWPGVREAVGGASLRVLGARRDRPVEGVDFLGRVSDDDKYAELAEAEVFVAPNLRGESFGIVVAEGMASGCAVVASGIPAFIQVLGDAAEIVAPGDVGALADRVSALLGDPERLRTLSERARRRVQRFDGALVTDAYIEAYNDAIIAHQS
ncbi:MAG: glycosyltransferase family 4 protein [Acidimicrobiia bacterium]|nr:MAG: glycosyltransferase family 4 protein [Acidimicrobiia bacterium]